MPTPPPRWSLIQMSSDQVMQNVLPALALRPERIVQIVSGRLRRSPRPGPDPMAAALALAGLKVEFGDIPLAQSHPTHTDVFEAVHQAVLEERQAGRTPVVNLTGGSKLMGIGAFAGASQTEAPAVYVDTPQKRFVLAFEGQPSVVALLQPLLAFDIALQSLSLEVIASAHRIRLGPNEDWHPRLALARAIAQNPKPWEMAVREYRHRFERFGRNGRSLPLPEDTAGWLELWSEPLVLPPAIGREAMALGCLILNGSEYLLNPGWLLPVIQDLDARNPSRQRSRPDFAARSRFQNEANAALLPVQNFLNLLFGGSWLEVLAAESLSRQPGIQDVRWSVPELDAAGNQGSEHDVLALWQGRLVRVSCKLGGPGERLSSAASEASHQARRLGGILSVGALCTGPLPDPRRRQAMLERASQEHILWIDLPELHRPDWFKPNL